MLIYQALLFDMDGVIVDTRQSVMDYWQEVAGLHGVVLTAADFEGHIHGRPAAYTLDVLFGRLSAEQRQAALERLVTYEAELAYEAVRGAVPLLEGLQPFGVPTALVTSAQPPKVAFVTGQLGIGHLFSVRVTADDIERGKPAPDPYLRAAEKLGVSPEGCVVFEDAISGVASAVAAGCLCVGVQAGGSAEALREAGARYVVPDLRAVRVVPNDGGLLVLEIVGQERLTLRVGERPGTD